MSNPRIFILSPAYLGGKRGRMLLREDAASPLAHKLRTTGAPLGEVFRFVSQLYFRGKLAYASAFSRPSAGAPGTLIITGGRGLLAPETIVTTDDLAGFASIDIDLGCPEYRIPLERDIAALASAAPDAEVVLLGSVASGKYVDIMLEMLGPQLLFPSDFVGRGDMSRGGLLLRAAESGEELECVPVAGAERRGPRPPRLVPRR